MLVSDVPKLSDEELRSQLKALGMDVGPIMDTTRKLYQRKLARFLGGEDAVLESDSLYVSAPMNSTSSDSLDGSLGNEDKPYVRERRQPFPEKRSPPIRLSHSPKPSFSARQMNSPFLAANAQLRKPESESSMTDHFMKFACFAIVVMVIVFFILNQDPGSSVEVRS